MSDDRDRDFELIKAWCRWASTEDIPEDEIKRFLSKRVSQVPPFKHTRDELLDLLVDCLPHLTPTLSVHEAVVDVLHEERDFRCKCGYCPKPGEND